MTADAHYYGRQTAPEADANGPTVLVVPVGSLEQHGPHLPLDTDTRIAVEIAERAVAALAGASVGPAIAVGASGEHSGFAGTLSIGTRALSHLIVEMVRTASADIEQIVFVNGHGGNAEALAQAEARCRHEGRPVVVWSPSIPGGDAHAGRTETSLMLAIAPHLVRLDRAEAGATQPLSDLASTLRNGGVAAVASNGVLGDPAGASAREGETILASLVAALVGVISLPVEASAHD